MNLKHVVQHHQLPLTTHLALAAQTEAPDPNRIGEVAKHRLHRAQPLAADVPVHRAVGLALIPFDYFYLPFRFWIVSNSTLIWRGVCW